MYYNNKFFTSLLMAGGLLVAAGCNKSIDKTPISTITASNFYKTASDAEAGLTGAYNALYQQYYIWDYMTNSDAQSDNCYAGGNNADNFAIDLIDTTGCGDGFTAGMLAGLLLGAAPVDAAWLGVACGSLVATGLGSDAGIEDLGQVLDFLERTQPAAAGRIRDRIKDRRSTSHE